MIPGNILFSLRKDPSRSKNQPCHKYRIICCLSKRSTNIKKSKTEYSNFTYAAMGVGAAAPVLSALLYALLLA